MLPDDGDHTETCWSSFNMNFITPFKEIFLAHELVIKNFDNKQDA
jgi:hypothetical protein